MNKKKIYFIAGENSGDFIGAKIISSLKNIEPNISLYGIGGPKMQAEGMDSLFSIDAINLMGFLEIIPHIFKIKKLIKKTIDDILEIKPDILITIDSPGFTYRVAKKIREASPNIKLLHVVAPSVWAYKPGRAKKYADLYDHLLTLLPFEPKYFFPLGLETTFIGHPILEQNFYSDKILLRKELNIKDKKKVIAVTAGSRVGEINSHMPIIKETLNNLAKKYDILVIFVQLNNKNIEIIKSHLTDVNFEFEFSFDSLKSFAVSDCVLAKSGTNNIEIAASNTAMIIGYKLNYISYFIVKMMIKIKYACLLNILFNRQIVPEFIQHDFTAENLSRALDNLLKSDIERKVQTSSTKKVIELLKNNNILPSKLAAEKIISLIT